MHDEYLTRLLGIQGFQVTRVELEVRKQRPAAIVYLERTATGYVCGRCQQPVAAAYDSREQEVQHLTLWQHLTFLRFWRVRVVCPTCGVVTEALPFVARHARITTALAALVAELCKVMTNQAVGLFQALHRGTVKEIDKRAIQQAHGARDLEGITTLGIDEIAVGRGQTYWHLVSALDGPQGPEVLFVGEGRKEKDLQPFWAWFGEARAQRITHAVMDMWQAFRTSFQAHCPGVQIIYDKFHVIQHLLKALNEVRKQELKRAGQTMRGVLAGKKFILLSRKKHLKGPARQALKTLLGLNRRLFKAHLLKETFGQLWSYTSKTWARKFFDRWVEQLKWSRLAPYQKFARLVEQHLDGILTYCDKKVPLGYIEGTNLKAKNIIRRAYGYRDKEDMKLKLIQGCSSIGVFRPWAFTHTNSS